MMSNRLDPTFVLAQIELLRLRYPQIWDDDDTLSLGLEGETDLHEVLALVVLRMRNAEALAIGDNVLINDLKERRDRFNRQYEAMRTLALKLMSAAEVRKVVLPQATLSISLGPRKVIVTDESRLPADCVRIKREPDRIAIKRFIEEGSTIPGAELSNAEEHLTVRPK
jgi:hypothetical protein